MPTTCLVNLVRRAASILPPTLVHHVFRHRPHITSLHGTYPLCPTLDAPHARQAFYPPTAQSTGPDTRPIKFGVLGAAAIAPLALITPAKTHPETVVYAIAARDKGRAEAFARKHGIERAYGGVGGYQGVWDSALCWGHANRVCSAA